LPGNSKKVFVDFSGFPAGHQRLCSIPLIHTLHPLLTHPSPNPLIKTYLQKKLLLKKRERGDGQRNEETEEEEEGQRMTEKRERGDGQRNEETEEEEEGQRKTAVPRVISTAFCNTCSRDDCIVCSKMPGRR